MPQQSAIDQFAEQLRMLRAEVGHPSLSEIVACGGRGQLARATISDHLSGKRHGLPSVRFVTAFYEACLACALSEGRNVDQLGTLDEWLDMLATAIDGAANLASPLRVAPTIRTFRPSGTSTPSAPLEPDQPDLLLSIYIPNERLYAAEQQRVLTLFRDWLSKTHKRGIRQFERSTSHGVKVDYYADGSVSLPQLKSEIEVFSYFLDKCVNSPATALSLLGDNQMGRAAAVELVTRFGKEVRRVEVDARHARERGMLALKQTLEESLFENDVDLRVIPGAQLDSMLETLVPYADSITPFAALTQQPVIHLPTGANVIFNQKIYSAMEQTIIEHVQGSVNLGVQAKEILALIDRFSAQQDGPALTAAVHELEDPDAPADSRSSAKVKLKKFLADLSGKIEDTAITILEKYLESKLGI